MTDIVTTTITIPTSGYIFLVSRGYLTMSGTTALCRAYVQIDETAGGGTSTSNYMIVGNDIYASTGTKRISLAYTRVFYKSAGTYTFRLEAAEHPTNSTSASISAAHSVHLTAMFFPTSYGTVTEVADDPNGDPDASLVSITDEDGNTQQGYKVDLRNLELRAKEAELKAFEAKQALEDAQNANQ